MFCNNDQLVKRQQDHRSNMIADIFTDAVAKSVSCNFTMAGILVKCFCDICLRILLPVIKLALTTVFEKAKVTLLGCPCKNVSNSRNYPRLVYLQHVTNNDLLG